VVDAKAKWWVAEVNGMGWMHVVDVEAEGGAHGGWGDGGKWWAANVSGECQSEMAGECRVLMSGRGQCWTPTLNGGGADACGGS